MGTTRTAAIREAALKLPPRERARLARAMIESLDEGLEREPGWEEAWTAEIERRSREIAAGTEELIDADVVFREARQELEALHGARRPSRNAVSRRR